PRPWPRPAPFQAARMARSTAKKRPLAADRPAAPPRRPWWAIGLAAAGVTVGALGVASFWVVDFAKWQGLSLPRPGQVSPGQPHLQRALARRPNDAEVVRELALGQLAAGRPGDAEPLLTRWCELRPRDAEPFKKRMELSMSRRQY